MSSSQSNKRKKHCDTYLALKTSRKHRKLYLNVENGTKLQIVLVRLLVPLKVMQVLQPSYINILVVCPHVRVYVCVRVHVCMCVRMCA